MGRRASRRDQRSKTLEQLIALHRDVEALDRILSEAVEERLRESTTIAEIPGELGHANEANFARAFRRWTGESSSARRCRSRIHEGPPR